MGVLDGLTGSQVGAGTAGLALVGDFFHNLKNLMPSEIEAQYEQSALDDLKRLQGGAGGMSQSARQTARAEALGQIDSTIAEQQAQAARGAASGASGQQFIRQAAALKAKTGAEQQAMSNIRQQDLDEAQRQRSEAYGKAKLAEDMKRTRQSMITKPSESLGQAAKAGAYGRHALGELETDL